MDRELFSLEDVARALGVSGTAVRRWITKGLIEAPPLRVGRSRVFTRAQVAKIRKATLARWQARHEARVRNVGALSNEKGVRG